MRIKTSNALIAAIASVFIAQSAFAVDGTITINGQITDATCGISVNNGTNNGTVTLPTVPASALGTVGSVAGTTPFNIVLSGCVGSTLDNAYAYFEPGTSVETSTGRLNNNSGTATGVQVRLLDKSSTAIMVGGASQGGVVEDISTGSATLGYYAQYYANGGTLSAGTVVTQVDYTIVYD
ncbi:fimbrial protein [Yersinia intermedia]|uniref:fimbrial protein n=1 Tax=Yersinia intermedia TaxID=631 RepID=UPI0022FE2645|nr:fimbrial protein [Yersinia intermedia]MDA5479823.1 fimbrial protein [Yersinia intermedia]